MWRRRLLNQTPGRAWMSGFSLLLCLASILIAGCKPSAATADPDTNHATAHSRPSALPRAGQDVEVAPNDLPPARRHVHLPLPLERHTDDLGGMVKRRAIRALVVINPINFFYEGGHPRGVMYEALEAFQKFVNRK